MFTLFILSLGISLGILFSILFKTKPSNAELKLACAVKELNGWLLIEPQYPNSPVHLKMEVLLKQYNKYI